jgi:hypothetical protein
MHACSAYRVSTGQPSSDGGESYVLSKSSPGMTNFLRLFDHVRRQGKGGGAPTTPHPKINLKKPELTKRWKYLAFGTRPFRMFSDVSANLTVAIVRFNDFGASFGRSCSKLCPINETAVDRDRFRTIEAERDEEQCTKGLYTIYIYKY